jgi:hypothetical protein
MSGLGKRLKLGSKSQPIAAIQKMARMLRVQSAFLPFAAPAKSAAGYIHFVRTLLPMYRK